MKRLTLLLTIVCALFVSTQINAGNDKSSKDKLHNKSQLQKPDFPPWNTSYPYPFTFTGDPINNPRRQAAISTGYYFVDSDDKVKAPWRPNPSEIFQDTTEDESNWRRILSGPNQKSRDYWEEHSEEGYRYFRNPNNMYDSTDNALAGPIPIGFKFVFNGIEYDSFYVSANGSIMLANSRYLYDENGDREVRSKDYGAPDCYNHMSEDWFFRYGRSGDGTGDTTADNWGWQKASDPDNILNPAARPDQMDAPVIAPFHGELHLSQYDKDKNKPRDWGKVYYYRSADSGRLIVYFVNIALHGEVNYILGDTINITKNKSIDENGYLGASCQVVLDEADSSVVFNYADFEGGYGAHTITDAAKIFRMNTHCGVTGWARHIGYNSKEAEENSEYTGTLPWKNHYEQTTYAWSKHQNAEINQPRASQAIKFKQWKNTLRVCDIAFRVRPMKQDHPYFTEKVLTQDAVNYEILAGHEQIGQLQPVGIIQNLTNDIQGPNGVNYQDQDVSFQLKSAIVSQALKRPLYNAFSKIDSAALAQKKGKYPYEKVILSEVKYAGENYEADTSALYDGNNELKEVNGYIPNGVPPYHFAQIYFRPFEPNELFISHIGRKRIFMIAIPENPATREGFEDMCPFDDTLSVPFWVMRHIESEETFKDDVTEYHVIEDESGDTIAIPSVHKWVNIGATVVSGEEVSRHPLPPRGEFGPKNEDVYPDYQISSPAIKLNRPASVPIQRWGGDEIRSFPIDIHEKQGAVLSLCVQRTANRDDWERGWSDNRLVGCEHRVVFSNWYAERQAPDELRIEFARPSPNWWDGKWIANVPEENWRYHPRRGGAEPETNMSAYSLFGGGGHMRGFHETDKDSALAPPVLNIDGKENGLRYDYFDDGIDNEYKMIHIPIPDTFINAPNGGAKYFRFRIKEHAKNNQRSRTQIPDDQDDFFVDNVCINYSDDEKADVGITKSAIEWPYTITPASQAIALPIRTRISNNTKWDAPTFWIKTRIVPKAAFDQLYFLDDAWVWEGDPNDKEMIEAFERKNQWALDSARYVLDSLAIYERIKQIPWLLPGAEEPIMMPNWNGRYCCWHHVPPGEYVVISNVWVPGGDFEPLNDTTYSVFNLRYGPVIAYDPVTNERNLNQGDNDVPEESGVTGMGLSLMGYSMGGVNNFPKVWEYGDPGGDGCSGQIAMKFNLVQEDTIFGYSAYFGEKNNSPEPIAYALYEGNDKPTNLIPGSTIETTRGWDDEEQDYFYGRYVTVKLPRSLVLPRGNYWLAVQQLGDTGIELGASKSKMGMRSTKMYVGIPETPDRNGSEAVFLNLNKSYRGKGKYGNLINRSICAYENGLGSGNWKKFTPTIGNPGYAHLLHTGRVPDGTETYSRGSWMPMLRPYLDGRYGFYPPVELVYFRGYVRDGANDLVWETASETDNLGFYVERRIVSEEISEWQTLPEFIQGYGTSKEPREYNYSDEDVMPNTTYQYRLRQVDIDGTQTEDDFSNIVTLTYKAKGTVVLEQNSPNPFESVTAINFGIPSRMRVKLEVLDIFGNIVETIVNEERGEGFYREFWRGRNGKGKRAAAGTYIYRLIAGGEVKTGKMTLVR